MSIDIVKNAKLQRPSVCNAIETILIHPESYKAFGEKLLKELIDEEVIIHADESIHSDIKQSELATDEDWYKEYRSEEHTSELQSRGHLVCRLLLEKKKH